MNKFSAIIKDIKKEDNVAYLKLDSNGYIFSALMLDFNNSISIGSKCNILFKENEVMVAHKNYKFISARNRFISPIIEIVEDTIFARIAFSFNNTKIYSLITKEAKNELGLTLGGEFMWFIKSNEITLEFVES